MTAGTASYPLPRERNLILGSLLVLAAAAWALLIWRASLMDDDMRLTMGMAAPLFIAVWIAMMVAIMFPTAAPMILTFARVHKQRREQGKPFVPTWLFTGSYILIWSATGLLAYGAAVGGDQLAQQSGWIMDNAARIGGAFIVVAGVYQLTPIKSVCLSRCRSPMSFILTSWRDGHAGSFRMGAEHAVYCLGCCWMLFVILFPLGMMNVAAMALIALLIFAEKSTPLGRHAASFAAVALVAYGLLVIAAPGLLPTVMDGGGMSEIGGTDSMSGME